MAAAAVVPESKLSVESGYASAASASSASTSSASTSRTSSAPSPSHREKRAAVVSLTAAHLAHLNARLEQMHPMDVLRFARTFFPGLYQSTAFGLTGLVTLDMLARLQRDEPGGDASSETKAGPGVPLIFLDTLHHFSETLALVDRVRARYPDIAIHVYRPRGADTVEAFEARHGPRLYEADAELYDWAAKVEPLQRAYRELDVAAVLTGRRRSQGGARGAIPVVEVDEGAGVVKINPLATWSFAQVKAYVDEHELPYNELLDRGYKSVGDRHSTSPVAEGEDERAGRWKGQAKTECGIHNSQSRYARYLREQQVGGGDDRAI